MANVQSRYGGSLETRSRNEMDVANDVMEYLKTYAKEKPEMAALWCFGIGFILGWKLKPW